MTEKQIKTNSLANENIFKKLFIAFSVVSFLSMSILSFDFGVTGDEADMNAYGDAILNFYISGGNDTTCLNMPPIHDRDKILKYYGGGFDFAVAMIKKISPLKEYNTRHLLNAWVGFLAMLFAGLIAKRLAGWRAGLIVLVIIFFSPKFFGHSMNNPKDIPFAATFIFSIWAMFRFYDNMHKLKWNDALLLGIAIASSIGIRFGGMLLIGYFGLFLIVEILHLEKGFGNIMSNPVQRMKPYFLLSVLAVTIAYFGGVVFWPYGFLGPLSHPFEALEKLGKLQVNLRQLFDGQQVFSSELPAHYLPKIMLITTPLLFVIGFFIAFPFTWLMRKEFNIRRVLFVLFTGVFPIFYIIYTDANVFHE
jgi:hypothetical protein